MRRRLRIWGATLLLAACRSDPAPPAAEAPEARDSVVTAPETTTAAEPDTAAAGTGTHWTVGDTRAGGTGGVALLREVRTARHDGMDRLVFQFAGTMPGYRISYIDRPVRQCGSGEVVPFRGDAWLSIVLEPAAAHTEQGEPTVRERELELALPNAIELKLICDFEAQVEWVAGLHSPTEYRVMQLREPARLVVDIRHPGRR